MADRIAVIDYGMGNLYSVSRAVEHVSASGRVELTSDPARVAAADRVVFPGQGAMPDCMREMDARGLRSAVLDAARNKPFLGICIGLQMLFDSSEEGEVAGLGILPGRVRRFAPAETRLPDGSRLKVPHMGWNQVRQAGRHPLWDGIEDDSRFYFVHSYFPEAKQPEVVQGVATYGVAFTCAVARDNIFAVQFHPEKSQSSGLRLLANFVHWNP
jgi:imidazole glycerol-phosphate synthase subunit HisH